MSDFLQRLFQVIQEEAKANPGFYARLTAAVGVEWATGEGRGGQEGRARPVRRHRRPKGLVDPMALMREGEDVLRGRLASLDVEELKDIIADHGMDTTKLAMKWRSAERLIDLIVSTSRDRLSKGEAFFRRDAAGNPIVGGG